MQFNLSNDEVAALSAALDSYFGDLRDEIYHTEDYDYRQELKQREAALTHIREQLEPGWAQKAGIELTPQGPVVPPNPTQS